MTEVSLRGGSVSSEKGEPESLGITPWEPPGSHGRSLLLQLTAVKPETWHRFLSWQTSFPILFTSLIFSRPFSFHFSIFFSLHFPILCTSLLSSFSSLFTSHPLHFPTFFISLLSSLPYSFHFSSVFTSLVFECPHGLHFPSLNFPALFWIRFSVKQTFSWLILLHDVLTTSVCSYLSIPLTSSCCGPFRGDVVMWWFGMVMWLIVMMVVIDFLHFLKTRLDL